MGNEQADKGSDKAIQTQESQEQSERDHVWRQDAIDQLERALQRMRDEEARWAEVRRIKDSAGLPPADERT